MTRIGTMSFLAGLLLVSVCVLSGVWMVRRRNEVRNGEEQ
jgi:hypothetical protein